MQISVERTDIIFEIGQVKILVKRMDTRNLILFLLIHVQLLKGNRWLLFWTFVTIFCDSCHWSFRVNLFDRFVTNWVVSFADKSLLMHLVKQPLVHEFHLMCFILSFEKLLLQMLKDLVDVDFIRFEFVRLVFQAGGVKRNSSILDLCSWMSCFDRLFGCIGVISWNQNLIEILTRSWGLAQ